MYSYAMHIRLFISSVNTCVPLFKFKFHQGPITYSNFSVTYLSIILIVGSMKDKYDLFCIPPSIFCA
jgi:hypothetical protein